MLVDASSGGGVGSLSILTVVVESDDTAGGREIGGGDGEGSGVLLGNGGKKAGMWDGGFHPELRGLFRGGVEGLEIGERGKGGVSGRGLAIR